MRCKDSGKLLSTYLNVLLGKQKIHPNTNSGIKRWNMHSESREKSIARSTEYGDVIYKKTSSSSKNEIHIYISHSSIIPSLISGILGKPLKKIKLHTACLSIIDANTRELNILNKSFK
jgi:hypothetical protein